MEQSAGVVLCRNGKYLLLHYPAGHWDFPKGHIGSEESEKDAAVRETLEETGISDLEFVDFREEIHYFYTRDGKRISKKVVYLLARTTTKDVTLSHEHQGFAWLTLDDALQRLTFDTAKRVLQKATDSL